VTVNRSVKIVEDEPGDGTIVEDGELVSFDLQITLNRGEVVHPRQRTTIRAGDRHVFPGLSKSVDGMRRGG
jgi:FKBP-type peptidyl-prolyl cis-trans isomerase 2